MIKKTLITLIVAASQNDVIGKDNQLPWHLPRDLQYFKQVTTGCPIIMGRKTYESIGKALPNRLNIVITRNTDYQSVDAEVVHDLQAGLELARKLQPEAREIHIIGGATIFEQTLKENIADKFYLNRVLADFEGDTFLPKVDWSHWQLVSAENHEPDAKNAYAMEFQVYLRQES